MVRQFVLRVYTPSLLRPDYGRLDDVTTIKIQGFLTEGLDAFRTVRQPRATEDQEWSSEV